MSFLSDLGLIKICGIDSESERVFVVLLKGDLPQKTDNKHNLIIINAIPAVANARLIT